MCSLFLSAIQGKSIRELLPGLPSLLRVKYRRRVGSFRSLRERKELLKNEQSHMLLRGARKRQKKQCLQQQLDSTLLCRQGVPLKMRCSAGTVAVTIDSLPA